MAESANAKHNADFSEHMPDIADASMYKHNRKNILDNDEFLSGVCREVIRRYQLIEGGCLNVLFHGWEPERVTSVIKRMMIHMCTYAWSKKQNQKSGDEHEAQLNRLYCTSQIESKRVDLYEVRKAHLRYMTKSGRVIGLQEVRNLADLLCRVLRDNGVHPGDVWQLRHSLFAMNIMQISGYFKVDQIRWEQEGIEKQFDGVYCKKMIAERGDFKKIEEVPKSAFMNRTDDDHP